MSAVITKPMPMHFESDDLEDDEVLDRCDLLLDFGDLVRLDELRRQANEIVVRQALVGFGGAQQRMLVFGYVADGAPTIWKGTLTALAREVAS
jgi:hypothetical protein